MTFFNSLHPVCHIVVHWALFLLFLQVLDPLMSDTWQSDKMASWDQIQVAQWADRGKNPQTHRVMWNWEFLSPKPLQSSNSLHHDSPITSGIRSQSDIYGYGSSEDRVPAFYFFTQLISTSYAISCPWALYICIWFNWNHVVCQLSKQKSPRSSDNSNDTRQRYAWSRIMCSTEERDLIHSLYLHRFLCRGTSLLPLIRA